MKRLTDGAGYFFQDNTASGGKREEDDIFACNHCSKMLKRSEWKNLGGFCTKCFKPLCEKCARNAPQTGCVPHIEAIQRAVDKFHHDRQMARIYGV